MGMPQPTSERRGAGRPPRISRPEILAAARAVIDAEGVAKLTMRRLAREVGSTPMALYHHVRDKEELLLLLLAEYAAGMPRPALPDDPRERILAVATGMRDGLAGCPWIVEVLAADDLLASEALWYGDRIVDAFMAGGLATEAAVHAYRAIWYYTAGEIIVRASAGRRAEAGRPTYRETVFADVDAAEYPRLAEIGADWIPLTAQDAYADGLSALVDGLLARAA
ncbi:TetR family transcriptional regulator [Actinomadura sp. J1-007]|nr:TetR family transcriptional regulator [Actinomadura sp. J1-007]